MKKKMKRKQYYMRENMTRALRYHRSIELNIIFRAYFK